MKTPDTLDEAIEQAICNGPMNELKERLFDVIKDFIANKTQVFMLNSSTEQQQLLSDLFELITKKEPVSEDFDEWVSQKEAENKEFRKMSGEQKLEFLKNMFYENINEHKKAFSNKLSDETLKGHQFRENKYESKKKNF